MKLAKNFSLSELTKSQSAVRKGIDNTPNAKAIANLVFLAENILQPARDHFGPVVVSSGFRSSLVNRAIGGSATSDHCYGYAADFEVPGVDNKVLAQWIRDNLKFRQLILEFYTPGDPSSGWVHCAYNVEDLKNQVLTASKVRGRTVYTKGIT